MCPAQKTYDRRLTSLNEAAVYADIHPRTLRRYVSAGRLSAYRLGPRLLRVDLNEVDAILRPIPTVGGRNSEPAA